LEPNKLKLEFIAGKEVALKGAFCALFFTRRPNSEKKSRH
jgi:hypothetical protein